MINLRYHIVSLTAVFLAIGIGLTLGSTFLDRATVDNLNGQLESLEQRLGDRDAVIAELEASVGDLRASRDALDEQATGLLAGALPEVPVLVITSQGTQETDVEDAVGALVVAGADVQGTWVLTDRFLLEDAAAIADLAEATDQDSTDPSRLRRTALAVLGGDLRVRQIQGRDEAPTEDASGADEAGADGSTTSEAPSTTAPATTQPVDGEADGTPPGPSAEPDDDVSEIATRLVETGFIELRPVPGTDDLPRVPGGVRILFVGGSSEVPDDVALEPLLQRLTRGTSQVVPVVVSSAMDGDDGISDIVSVVREDDVLRTQVSTVDHLEHFADLAATVLALRDLDEGVVGHYGLGEGASRLLPAVQAP